MKALTLHQPWASLVALGVKTIETRSWATKYRGPLAIHASKTTKGFDLLPGDCEGTTEGGWRYGYIGDYQAGYCYRSSDEGTRGETFLTHLEGSWRDDTPPLGAIVATCRLVDVVVTDDLQGDGFEIEFIDPAGFDDHSTLTRDIDTETMWHVTAQRPYGDFTPGRFAWLLDDIVPTTERCGCCMGSGRCGPPPPPGSSWLDCPYCSGAGKCEPIRAKGRQGLWKWTP